MNIVLRFLRMPANPVEWIAIGLAIVILFIAVFGIWLAPHDPLQINFRGRLDPPTWDHPFGTDASGRDILSRVLAGARLTVLSTFAIVLSVLVIGCAIGITSAISYNRNQRTYHIDRSEVNGTTPAYLFNDV